MGEITGVSAELIIALAEPFRQAMRDELAPERYPFTRHRNHAPNQVQRRRNPSAACSALSQED